MPRGWSQSQHKHPSQTSTHDQLTGLPLFYGARQSTSHWSPPKQRPASQGQVAHTQQQLCMMTGGPRNALTANSPAGGSAAVSFLSSKPGAVSALKRLKQRSSSGCWRKPELKQSHNNCAHRQWRHTSPDGRPQTRGTLWLPWAA